MPSIEPMVRFRRAFNSDLTVERYPANETPPRFVPLAEQAIAKNDGPLFLGMIEFLQAHSKPWRDQDLAKVTHLVGKAVIAMLDGSFKPDGMDAHRLVEGYVNAMKANPETQDLPTRFKHAERLASQIQSHCPDDTLVKFLADDLDRPGLNRLKDSHLAKDAHGHPIFSGLRPFELSLQMNKPLDAIELLRFQSPKELFVYVDEFLGRHNTEPFKQLPMDGLGVIDGKGSSLYEHLTECLVKNPDASMDFIDALCEKMAHFSRENIAPLLMSVAALYTLKCPERHEMGQITDDTVFDRIVHGPFVKDLQANIEHFINAPNWYSVHNDDKGNLGTGYMVRTAELYRIAIANHVPQLMDLCAPVARSAAEGRAGPSFEEVVALPEALPTEPSLQRYQLTFDYLKEMGHDPAQTRNARHMRPHQHLTPLHAYAGICSEEGRVTDLLPVLLNMGSDPNTVNAKGQTPRDLIQRSHQITEQWDKVILASRARDLARQALDMLDELRIPKQSPH